jgi:rhodanese-related sulfurtransferase
MAGFIAENILLDRLNIFYWNDLGGSDDNSYLLDVRTVKEFEAGHIEGAVNIPVDEIRQRLQEIPQAKRIDIYCEAGLRGYLANRILRQNGFNEVFNLSGGYVLWNACTRETALARPVTKQAALV